MASVIAHFLQRRFDVVFECGGDRGSGRDDPAEASHRNDREEHVAGDGDNARRTLGPVLAAHDGVPERVRLQACLADARLSYHSGDCARGRRSLGRALRLAERERLRLPFILERGWIAPVLRREPDLAHAYRHLLPSVVCGNQLPAPPGAATQGRAGAAAQDTMDTPAPGMTTVPVVEPLTEREREVLQHVSGMLTTAEIASELYISTNTVKSHIKSICHKLAATHRGEAVRRARQLQLI
jgi:LuxR family maltose regulon positive regulatory protein